MKQGAKRVNAKSKWLGLWDCGNGVHISSTLRKHEIPPHAKLVVKENEYYNAGTNRPKFVYCFAAGDEADAISLDVEYKE